MTDLFAYVIERNDGGGAKGGVIVAEDEESARESLRMLTIYGHRSITKLVNLTDRQGDQA